MAELEEIKKNGAIELLGAVEFYTDNDRKMYAKPLVGEKIDEMTPEEFAKAFLIDRVLNQNVRNAMAKENTSRNSGMDR